MSRDEVKCPHCGDTRQVECDVRLRVWFCATCGRAWPMAPKVEP